MLTVQIGLDGNLGDFCERQTKPSLMLDFYANARDPLSETDAD